MRSALSSLWRSRLLPPAAKSALAPFAQRVAQTLAVPPWFDTRRQLPPQTGPLIVSGYLGEPFGIGRAGRMTFDGLSAAGLSPQRHEIRPFLTGHGFRGGRLPVDTPGGVWLIHANPEEAAAVFSRLPKAQWAHRYRIGYWAWELPEAPAFWRDFARMFHEIWVPSRFVAEALKGARAPVRVVPHPVDLPSLPAAGANKGEGGCRFLSMGDLKSSATRKNLAGALEAFRRAFPTPSGQASLTVKISSPNFDPSAFSALTALASGRPDIHLIDAKLSDDEMDRLHEEADVYLSLHRAEGFGLGLAEAFARGKPAIATAYSGTLDFMEGLDPALVPYSLIPVHDRAGVYEGPGQRWAEPDLEVAAARIRAFAGDAALRQQVAEQGRRHLEANLGVWSRESLCALPFADYLISGEK